PLDLSEDKHLPVLRHGERTRPAVRSAPRIRPGRLRKPRSARLRHHRGHVDRPLLPQRAPSDEKDRQRQTGANAQKNPFEDRTVMYSPLDTRPLHVSCLSFPRLSYTASADTEISRENSAYTRRHGIDHVVVTPRRASPVRHRMSV